MRGKARTLGKEGAEVVSRMKFSERRMPRAVRARLVASIARDVGALVNRDRFRSLELVMEATGYLSNRGSSTSQTLGDAIVALANVIEASWLEGTARCAAFERVFDRTNEEGISPVSRPGRWRRADAAADRVVRRAGLAAEGGAI